MQKKNTITVVTTAALAVGLACGLATPASAATSAFGAVTTADVGAPRTDVIPGSSTEVIRFGGTRPIEIDGERWLPYSSQSALVTGRASHAGTFHVVDADGRELCAQATDDTIAACQISGLRAGDRTLTAYVETADGEQTAPYTFRISARVEKPEVTAAVRHGATAVIEGTATPGATVEAVAFHQDDVLATADATDGSYRLEVPVAAGQDDVADAYQVRAVAPITEGWDDPEDPLGTSAWVRVDVDTDAGEVGEPGDGTEQPGDGTDEPGDGTEEPGDGTEEPGAGTEEPGDGTEEPGDGTEEPGDGTEQPGDGTEEPGDGGQPAPADPIDWVHQDLSTTGAVNLQVNGAPHTRVTGTDPFGRTVSAMTDASGFARLQFQVPSVFTWTVSLHAEHDGATSDRTMDIGSGPRVSGSIVSTVVRTTWGTSIWIAGATGSLEFHDEDGTLLRRGSVNAQGIGQVDAGSFSGLSRVVVTDATGAATTVELGGR